MSHLSQRHPAKRTHEAAETARAHAEWQFGPLVRAFCAFWQKLFQIAQSVLVDFFNSKEQDLFDFWLDPAGGLPVVGKLGDRRMVTADGAVRFACGKLDLVEVAEEGVVGHDFAGRQLADAG